MRDHGDHQPQPTATLVGDIAAAITRLVKGELLLARVEATEGLRIAAAGLVKVAAAAILALVGLNLLAGAAVAALAATGMGTGTAALLIGIGLLGLSFGLVLSARAALRLKRLLPQRAMNGLARDAQALRAGFHAKGASNV